MFINGLDDTIKCNDKGNFVSGIKKSNVYKGFWCDDGIL